MSSKNLRPVDLINTKEARELLNVSRIKIAELLKTNQLRHFIDPLDRRVKLVSKAEVLAFKGSGRAQQAA